MTRGLQGIAGVCVLLAVEAAQAIELTAGGSITEGFGIGTAATAVLPTDWKADKNATVRLVGTYAAAGTATERLGGNSMSTTAQNGIYNYGAGDAASATDRAVGFLSSGSATKSGNLYVRLDNTGGTAITALTLSYNVEKYRKGSNAAGFSIQLYYSTDGSAWTSAGSDFLTSFAADVDNSGYAAAPGVTTAVSNKVLSQPVAAGGSIYLAWNYSVTSTTTSSNAQGLGVDDVSITAGGEATLPPPTGLASTDATADGFTATWGAVQGAEGYRLSAWTIATLPGGDAFVPVAEWTNYGVAGTSQVVTALAAKTTYYWSVVAVAGTVESSPSELAEITTLAAVSSVDAPTVLSIEPSVGGGMRVSTTSQTGATYALRWRASLVAAPDWAEVAGSAKAGTGGTLLLTDPVDRGDTCYYQVQATVP